MSTKLILSLHILLFSGVLACATCVGTVLLGIQLFRFLLNDIKLCIHLAINWPNPVSYLQRYVTAGEGYLEEAVATLVHTK